VRKPSRIAIIDADAEQTRLVEAVKVGEAQLDRGEYLTHEEVGERIERLFQS
jgi:predicted transcriptional regulator